MLRALRNRTIALLWTGQALSAIGDEIYRVALIWLAVGLIGADTGYLAAGQFASLLLLSLIGGKWADNWDPLPTMVWVDGLRAALVLVPVALYYLTPLSLTPLVFVAILVSALSAFFDPALQSSLPEFCPNTSSLQAANGLMGITARLARVAGPGIVGFLSTFVPIIHFFTIDALSFAISAISVGALKNKRIAKADRPKVKPAITFSEAVKSGFRLIRRTPGMNYIMGAKATTTAMWNLAYGLGLALLVSRISPHDIKAFGLVVASYGAGNLGGALILGNMQRRNPIHLMFGGYIWLGAGFVMVGLAPSLGWAMLAAAFPAIGGPLNDMPFFDLVQTQFQVKDLAKVFRLRMALENGATLIVMLAAPLILKMISVNVLIVVCGGTMVLAGVCGLFTVAAAPFAAALGKASSPQGNE